MANLRLRVLPRLPVSVTGENGITASVSNGVMTVGPDWADLALVDPLVNPEDKEFWTRDDGTGIYNRVSIQSLINAISADAIGTATVVTGASHTVTDIETAIIINRSNPSATTITLPAIAGRNGVSLSIIDLSTGLTGDHTITINPNGAEKIMRESSWQIISTSVSLETIRMNPNLATSNWVFL